MILGSIITFLACSLVAAIVEVARTRAALHDEQSLLREYRIRMLAQDRLVITALRRLEGLDEIPMVEPKMLGWGEALRKLPTEPARYKKPIPEIDFVGGVEE